jgi:hypothetical protein
VTPEQVAYDYDEQPEPEDEHKHCEGIGEEITESETFCEEQHRDPPCFTWRTFWTRLIDGGQPCPTLGIRFAGDVTGIYQNTAHIRVNANSVSADGLS